MLTLEMAIQKIKQFTPEQQQKVIEFIEFLELQTQRENQANLLDEKTIEEIIQIFEQEN